MYAVFLLAAAGILDSSQGTLKASQGAVQRALDPSYYDAFFPVFAFLMVIVVPSLVALWAIYKTWMK